MPVRGSIDLQGLPFTLGATSATANREVVLFTTGQFRTGREIPCGYIDLVAGKATLLKSYPPNTTLQFSRAAFADDGGLLIPVHYASMDTAPYQYSSDLFHADLAP